jgi:uncharacterized membrane protein
MSKSVATPDRQRWLPAVVLLVLTILAMSAPPAWLAPLDTFGNAVCHRIAERSFFAAGQQLPVCARDTGMFMGALLGLVFLGIVLPDRRGLYPAQPFFALFVALFAFWAVDGFNSYMLLLRREVFIYPPNNTLRLITGALMGISLSAFVAALFNQAVWRNPVDRASVDRWPVFAGLLGVAAILVLVVVLRTDAMYGALALLSALGILALLTVVNSVLLMIIRKTHSTFDTWRQLSPYICAGVALSIIEVSLISALRDALVMSAISR